MRFFDASAIVKGYVRESASPRVRELLDGGGVALSQWSEREFPAKPGRYVIAAKIIDIFGNDTMSLTPVTVGDQDAANSSTVISACFFDAARGRT